MSFADDMENRLRKFANGAVAFCRTLPCTDEAREWGSQLRRASTGASANYRASRRAKSKADWLSTISDALKEIDEAHGWLQTINENGVAVPSQDLRTECQELRAILAKSVATARRNQRSDRANQRRRRSPDLDPDPQR